MTKDKKVEEVKHQVMKTGTSNEMVISVEGTEGRVYKFSMPFFAPLPECYDAGINILNEVARLFNEAVELAKTKAAEEKTEESVEVVTEKKDN